METGRLGRGVTPYFKPKIAAYLSKLPELPYKWRYNCEAYLGDLAQNQLSDTFSVFFFVTLAFR